MESIRTPKIILEKKSDGTLILEIPLEVDIYKFLHHNDENAKLFINLAFLNGSLPSYRKNTNSVALKNAARESGIDLMEALKILYPTMDEQTITCITTLNLGNYYGLDTNIGDEIGRHASGILDILDGKIK